VFVEYDLRGLRGVVSLKFFSSKWRVFVARVSAG
jgi:hypothetical protein